MESGDSWLYLETILCKKTSEFMYMKKFDNAEWDLDKIDIGMRIYFL